MIKTQLWKPDTCKCVIMQKWDTNFPEQPPIYISAEEYVALTQNLRANHANIIDTNRVNENVKKINICSIHTAHGHTKDLLTEVLKHNRLEKGKKIKHE